MRLRAGLVGRELLHLHQEPVRVRLVRCGLLGQGHMHRARAMHWSGRVLMLGDVVGGSLLDMRAGPVWGRVVL